MGVSGSHAPTPGPSPVEGGGRRIPRTLDLELHQRGTDRPLLAGFALGGGDAAARLEKQQCGHETVGAHDFSFSPNMDNRWPHWSGRSLS